MTEVKLKYKVLIWVAIVVFTSAKVFFSVHGFSEAHGLPFNAYYAAEALTHFLLALITFLSLKKHWIPALLLNLTFCHLADELVFNPFLFECKEVGLVATFFVTWFALKKIKEYESYD